MRNKAMLIFTFLIIIPNASAMIINEIFYDYPGADDDHEWIEIFNDENISVDITGWKFFEDGTNHNLNLISGSFVISSGGYAIISDDDVQFLKDYPGFNSTLIDSSFSLSNTGETLVLKNSSLEEVFNITYFSSWGGDGNNKSICFFNNSWGECSLTPGYDNSLFVENIIQGDYSKIKINEFLPDPNGYDNDEKPNGEFIELYNDADEDFDLDKFYFKDDLNHKVSISDTNTLSGTLIKSKSYLVVYPRHGNGFLNNDGYERLLFYDFNDNLIEEVSYSRTTEGASWSKIGKTWIQTISTPDSANIYNESFSDSILFIDTVYLGNDKKAKFGDTLRVKVTVYKGNSSKTSISLFAENENYEISKQTRFNVDERYTNSTFTVPLQLFPNCNGKFEDGVYDIVIKGFDAINKYEINVEGITNSLCEKIKVEGAKTKSIDYDLLSFDPEVLAGEEISTVLLIRNNDKTSRKYETWSYIYSGKKSYSGEREENKKIITIPADKSATISLKNTVFEEGEYNLKVMIKKEDRKTPADITNSIKIVGNAALETDDEPKISYQEDSVLYTSSSLKARRNAMLFFNLSLVLIILKLLINKVL